MAWFVSSYDVSFVGRRCARRGRLPTPSSAADCRLCSSELLRGGAGFELEAAADNLAMSAMRCRGGAGKIGQSRLVAQSRD